MIGPGATAPGGWLRVAKEGGKHSSGARSTRAPGASSSTTTSATWRGRTSTPTRRRFGWRTLEAGAHTLETTSDLDAPGNWNLRRARPRAALLADDAAAAAQLLVGVPGRRRRTGALRRPRGRRRHGARAGRLPRWALELATDPRGSFAATLANQTQFIAGGSYATSLQMDAGGPRPPPARHRAPAPAHLVGRRVSPRARGVVRGRRLLRQAGRQERERHAARLATRSRRS